MATLGCRGLILPRALRLLARRIRGRLGAGIRCRGFERTALVGELGHGCLILGTLAAQSLGHAIGGVDRCAIVARS